MLSPVLHLQASHAKATTITKRSLIAVTTSACAAATVPYTRVCKYITCMFRTRIPSEGFLATCDVFRSPLLGADKTPIKSALPSHCVCLSREREQPTSRLGAGRDEPSTLTSLSLPRKPKKKRPPEKELCLASLPLVDSFSAPCKSTYVSVAQLPASDWSTHRCILRHTHVTTISMIRLGGNSGKSGVVADEHHDDFHPSREQKKKKKKDSEFGKRLIWINLLMPHVS